MSFLNGLLVTVLGHLSHRSVGDLADEIERYGGRFSERMNSSVDVVVSTEEVADILHNPYKLQFFPELKDDVDFAITYSIPIVDDSYIDDCISRRSVLNTSDYLIEAFIVDVESRYKVKEDVPSNLDPRVQEIVNLLFDQQELDRSLVDMGMDVRKMKLVTEEHIRSAFRILKELEGNLQPGPNQSETEHEKDLSRMSEQFYSLIPHRGSTPVIKTTDAIKEKSKLLDSLTDIEIAQRLMSERGEEDLNMNPIDVNYRKLRCEINPLERYRSEYQLIEDMVNNTQSDEFDFEVEVDTVFEIDRAGEEERFEPYKKLPHHRLLWHGSRLTNYIGILSQGLRIAPPEAPVTGYFLGKGIYLADMVSVSSQYCHASKDHPYGFLLLVDSALGRSFQLAHGKFIGKEDLDEAGFHSVKCWGTKGPDPGYDTQTQDGTIVSLGKEVNTGVPVSELVHNEIVLYDPSQARMKYLVKLKFNFPDKMSI
eukprot:TRINITY_DN12865_c0_g1_i1.p1 TRINITY_DN12865_c0_g1~~TRINITY_DN12865_c0_g1_i1.p1  ORF type:complete len:501 (-),score=112.46 TRINITY_DN12865_c0_g1_i1:47-1489(-)